MFTSALGWVFGVPLLPFNVMPRRNRAIAVNMKEESDSDETEFEVERVVGKRLNSDGEVEYRIRWRNFTEQDDTWEAAEKCNCPNLIADFERVSQAAVTPRHRGSVAPKQQRQQSESVSPKQQRQQSESVSPKRRQQSESVSLTRRRRQSESVSLTRRPISESPVRRSTRRVVNASPAETATPSSSLKRRSSSSRSSVSAPSYRTPRRTPAKRARYEESDKSDDDQVEYAVEKVVGVRVVSGKTEYRIRWKGYDEDDDTWEAAANCRCPDAIAAFEESQDSGSSSRATRALRHSRRSSS